MATRHKYRRRLDVVLRGRVSFAFVLTRLQGLLLWRSWVLCHHHEPLASRGGVKGLIADTFSPFRSQRKNEVSIM
ncbi:hypothetical protein BJ165DRAFT_1501798 [Panaeolus papilionaceus]|nr:hypothetical protein BJ165DRAFT_1501798 [Panaeolus papilionaceus]